MCFRGFARTMTLILCERWGCGDALDVLRAQRVLLCRERAIGVKRACGTL